MPLISSAYRGPLVIIGLGCGFSAVGAVPVAITFSIGVRTSATIIGMGFIGFGFLLILPGLFWCLMVRTHSFKSFRRRRKATASRSTEDGRAVDEDGENTPALDKLETDANHQPNTTSSATSTGVRSKCWPPTYTDPPPLVITDYSVCRATSPTTTTTATASVAAAGTAEADAAVQQPTRSDAEATNDAMSAVTDDDSTAGPDHTAVRCSEAAANRSLSLQTTGSAEPEHSAAQTPSTASLASDDIAAIVVVDDVSTADSTVPTATYCADTDVIDVPSVVVAVGDAPFC